MSNLIRREDVIAKFKKTCTSESIDKNGVKRGEIHTAMTYEGIIKIIESLPSAEPEQQKGEWIKEDLSGYLTPGGNSIYHCSECGHTEGPWPWPRLTNFCPSCGADMRGD